MKFNLSHIVDTYLAYVMFYAIYSFYVVLLFVTIILCQYCYVHLTVKADLGQPCIMNNEIRILYCYK